MPIPWYETKVIKCLLLFEIYFYIYFFGVVVRGTFGYIEIKFPSNRLFIPKLRDL